MGDWVWHACIMTHNSPAREHVRHNLINLVNSSFLCQNIKNDTILLCFFAICWVLEPIIKGKEGSNSVNIE